MGRCQNEKRFHDLSLFSLHFIPIEEHMIEKLKDGFRQDLRQALIALQHKH
jgi:hypothetical protein